MSVVSRGWPDIVNIWIFKIQRKSNIYFQFSANNCKSTFQPFVGRHEKEWAVWKKSLTWFASYGRCILEIVALWQILCYSKYWKVWNFKIIECLFRAFCYSKLWLLCGEDTRKSSRIFSIFIADLVLVKIIRFVKTIWCLFRIPWDI